MVLQKSNDCKRIKKFIKKNNKILVKNQVADGVVYLNSIRIYENGYVEVDITFDGKLCFRYIGQTESQWYKSNCDRRSNIKTNKMIRRGVLTDVKNYLKFFDIDLKFRNDIKKVKWVSND